MTSPKDSTEITPPRIPVTLVSGALGVGKTTAITHLLTHARPAHERWAVLVNEIGEVGIDAALLGDGVADPSEVALQEVPGGCICCTSGVMFQIHLTLLIKRARPDRLLIEPTGIASPGAILDMLRSPSFRDVLSPRATITLVDPRRLFDPRHAEREAYHDQIEAADLLVANRTDLCDPEELLRFEQHAASLFPPKLLVATTSQGVLDPAWLDLDPQQVRVDEGDAEKANEIKGFIDVKVDRRGGEEHPPDGAPQTRHDRFVHACGWRFPATTRFLASALRDWLEALPAHPALPSGFLRAKGVVQTELTWVSFNITADEELEARQSSHRRDLRIELLAPPDGEPPDWATLDASLRAALLPDGWQP